jgi:hypothetical protein
MRRRSNDPQSSPLVKTFTWGTFLLMVACSSSTEPKDNFQREIGETCQDLHFHSSANLEADGSWTVHVYYNYSEVRIVADDRGILREQTVRSCRLDVGVGVKDPSVTDERSAIDFAANLFGVIPVY